MGNRFGQNSERGGVYWETFVESILGAALKFLSEESLNLFWRRSRILRVDPGVASEERSC